MSKLLRIVLLPLGLVLKLWEIAIEGSRDLSNKQRFRGSKIDAGCMIDLETSIEPNVHILGNCIINKSKVASYTYIGRNCLVQNLTIGKFCSIANDVFVGLGTHPIDRFSTSPLFYKRKNTFGIELVGGEGPFAEYRPITIGHDVWIGARAIVLDGVTVGTGAIIAANSVVTKDVPPYAIVAGSPAKIIKYRFDKEKIYTLLDSKWWEKDLVRIKHSFNDLNKL